VLLGAQVGDLLEVAAQVRLLLLGQLVHLGVVLVAGLLGRRVGVASPFVGGGELVHKLLVLLVERLDLLAGVGQRLLVALALLRRRVPPRAVLAGQRGQHAFDVLLVLLALADPALLQLGLEVGGLAGVGREVAHVGAVGQGLGLVPVAVLLHGGPL